VWGDVHQRLSAYFADQGVPDISIERSAELPAADPKTGKFRQVWSV
jgi:hypothetical protein